MAGRICALELLGGIDGPRQLFRLKYVSFRKFVWSKGRKYDTRNLILVTLPTVDKISLAF